MWKWIVQVLTPILCGLAVLLAVIAAGRSARASLHDRAAYSLRFSDIDCPVPEGMSRDGFLREVRAMTRQPPALRLLDGDLTARLHRAFLAHPFVESVHRVAIDRQDARASHAKKNIRVEMEFRRAVLAVPFSDEDTSGNSRAKGGWRMVDRHGILLPARTEQPHQPVLVTEVAAPAGPPGCHWGDGRVTAAAQTVAFLQTHWTRLHLEGSQIEIVEGNLVLRWPGACIVWGHAPGQEKEDEAPANVKLRRLLDYQKEHDGWESLEHDVRFLAYQGHFPLSPEKIQNSVSCYQSRQISSARNCVTVPWLQSREGAGRISR